MLLGLLLVDVLLADVLLVDVLLADVLLVDVPLARLVEPAGPGEPIAYGGGPAARRWGRRLGRRRLDAGGGDVNVGVRRREAQRTA